MTATQGAPRRPRAVAPVLARGPRVDLRRLTATDAQAFVTAVVASRALHGSWVSPPATTSAFVARMKTAAAPDSRWVPLVAVRRDDGGLAGVFNLSEIVRGLLQQAYLGYYALAPNAGQGYMQEALPLVLRFAFRSLKLHRIEANIQPGNQASIALVQGAGFVREGFSERYLKIAGRWRDHERWAINAEQWTRHRRAMAGRD